MDKVKCILCGKVVSGGIYRLKQHIAQISGNVAKCRVASKDDQEKCRNSINEAKNKKKTKKAQDEEVRGEVTIEKDRRNDDEELDELVGGSEPRKLGPMDKFANPIDPHVSSLSSSQCKRQQNIIESISKERTHKVRQYIARWVYSSGEDIDTWGWGGANGTFFEEGYSSGGQLGHGNNVDYFEPMMVKFGINARAVHVSCGFNHTGAIFGYDVN